MVCNWLSMIVEDDVVICDGMGHAIGRSTRVFYTYNGIIGSQEQEWIHGACKILIGLFHHIFLMTNITKSKNMTCQLGTIQLEMP